MNKIILPLGMLSLMGCSSVTVESGADSGAASTDPAADSGSPATDAPAEPLCDGSDTLRLTYTSTGGGQTEDTFAFTNPHGHAYLLVDGKCRYYASDRYMRGIITGTLSAEEAAQLSADVHWSELDQLSTVEPTQVNGCFDAGGTALTKAHAAVSCGCGCAGGPVSDALVKAREWFEMLMESGEPIPGPVSALVQVFEGFKSPGQPELDWPLARPMDEIPNLITERIDPRLKTGPWAVFDAPEEYTKLRELREQTLSTDIDMPNSSIGISRAVLISGGQTGRALFVRDELPAEIEQAWRDLDATLPE
jgi:hypothetical protein